MYQKYFRHPGCDLDLSAPVVQPHVGRIGRELNAVLPDGPPNTVTAISCIIKKLVTVPRRFPSWPGAVEKSPALEVAVELVEQFDLQIGQDFSLQIK